MQKLLSDYGMIVVLLALCLLFTLATLKQTELEGPEAVAELLPAVQNRLKDSDVILAIGAARQTSAKLAEVLGKALQEQGFRETQIVLGTPRDVRLAMDKLTAEKKRCAAIVTGQKVANWLVMEQLASRYPDSKDMLLLTPSTRIWPDFLKRTNLLAIVDRIVVIAVIAIGMTLVIVTGGIDLSVGSLIALSAVVGTMVMKQLGGQTAPDWAVAVGFLAGTLTCGLIGAFGGLLVTHFKVAPFITTLAIMMIASGLAFKATGGFSIYLVPEALPWLGQGRTLHIPNTVIMLVVLYVSAHIFMSHTRMGRYIYAVGGNEEAARLSGVPVGMVIVFVYLVSGLSAGLGGCIQASQINTGTPNMGNMYELFVIAAVVVGGTSLSGGSGRILGTLIGALIISVIQNGMNLLGMDSYTQKIVLGGVILDAVLLDKLRSGQHLTQWSRSKG